MTESRTVVDHLVDSLRDATLHSGQGAESVTALCTSAADEIVRLRRELNAKSLAVEILRSQIRGAGLSPAVVENEQIGEAEAKMRRAAHSH